MEKVISSATDNIYRDRYLLFYMEDGYTVSSREHNWHAVQLDKVKMLELVIRRLNWRIRKTDLPDSFVEFVHFRTKGIQWISMDGNVTVEPEEFNSWSIGWSDGKIEHLAEVDFQTGKLIRNYQRPCTNKLPSHFHPQSKVLERGVR